MSFKSIVYASLAFVASQGCSASAVPTPTMGVYDLSSQRISGKESVNVVGARGFDDISFLVTVDINGGVIDATVSENRSGVDASIALSAIKAWKFKPQAFDGHPIQAVGVVRVQLDPPEIAPDMSVPFPDANPADVEITLERSACFGSCPDYKVSLTGDGKVRFSTRENAFPGTAAEVHRMFNGRNVVWPGVHEANVDPNAVASLLERFRASHFMGMKSEYIASVTDNATQALTLRIGNVTKRVVDYVGPEVGMPASIRELEAAVDEVAGSKRWVLGNRQTIDLLKAEGFDFRGQDAADLVASAIQLNRWPPDQGDLNQLVNGAIAEGLNLSLKVVPNGDERNRTSTIGAMIAQLAAQAGNEELFDEMSKRGQVALMDRPALNAAFASDMGCSPSIAKALVAAGADPKATGERGNALHALRESWGRCSDVPGEKRVEMASTLVALGVPLEARDDNGWTPIMGCDDPFVTQVLLQAGANANAKDEDGTTVVLSVDDDRAALSLLRSGADPHVKDSNGTLRQQALKSHWPATLAWLDANAVK